MHGIALHKSNIEHNPNSEQHIKKIKKTYTSSMTAGDPLLLSFKSLQNKPLQKTAWSSGYKKHRRTTSTPKPYIG